MKKDFLPRQRIVGIILDLLEQPKGYTAKYLGEKYGKNPDTIKEDIKFLRYAGFIIEADEQHRYAFKENKPYKALKNLLHFSEDEKEILERAIDQVSPHSKRGEQLKKKLAALYDYHKLGHAYLRKPYLKKIDILEKAINEKKIVLLKDYRSSNSNDIRDRLVEPFHIIPADDNLHAFDVHKNEIRHFRISRFIRVQETDMDWQNEGKHHIILTDPFRINNDKQIPVHLRFKIGAYNEIIERFPKAEAVIQEDAEEGIYDFQCMVNEDFKGLTNFILGFHHQLVEIVDPPQLREHLAGEVKKIQKKLGII